MKASNPYLYHFFCLIFDFWFNKMIWKLIILNQLIFLPFLICDFCIGLIYFSAFFLKWNFHRKKRLTLIISIELIWKLEQKSMMIMIFSLFGGQVKCSNLWPTHPSDDDNDPPTTKKEWYVCFPFLLLKLSNKSHIALKKFFVRLNLALKQKMMILMVKL